MKRRELVELLFNDDHGDVFYSLAHSIVRDWMRAGDVMQDVALRIWRLSEEKVPHLPTADDAIRWLRTCVRNMALDSRRKYPTGRDYHDPMILEHIPDPYSVEMDPDEALESTNPLYTLATLIDGARPDHRRLVVSWLVKKARRKEMARILSRTPGGVGMAFDRFKKGLEEKFEASLREEGKRYGQVREPFERACRGFLPALPPRGVCLWGEEADRLEATRFRQATALASELGVSEVSARRALLLEEAGRFSVGSRLTLLRGSSRPNPATIAVPLGRWYNDVCGALDRGEPAIGDLSVIWLTAKDVIIGNELEQFAYTRFRRWVLFRVIVSLSEGLGTEWDVEPLLADRLEWRHLIVDPISDACDSGNAARASQGSP